MSGKGGRCVCVAVFQEILLGRVEKLPSIYASKGKSCGDLPAEGNPNPLIKLDTIRGKDVSRIPISRGGSLKSWQLSGRRLQKILEWGESVN